MPFSLHNSLVGREEVRPSSSTSSLSCLHSYLECTAPDTSLSLLSAHLASPGKAECASWLWAPPRASPLWLVQKEQDRRDNPFHPCSLASGKPWGISGSSWAPARAATPCLPSTALALPTSTLSCSPFSQPQAQLFLWKASLMTPTPRALSSSEDHAPIICAIYSTCNG